MVPLSPQDKGGDHMVNACWEAEVAVSWLSWKKKAQKIFAHVRDVYNPLSLNIRLLTVEN